MAAVVGSSEALLDRTATKILFRRYWGPTGWAEGVITPAEFEYAKRAGVMFDPVNVTHAQLVERVIRVRREISPERVGRAFLASLSTRRLDWRSSLGSLATILHFPNHSYASRPGSNHCAVCGELAADFRIDLSVLNFERMKWGGVRHDQALYASLDLEWFTKVEVQEPTQEDIKTLSLMIERLSALPATARPAQLEKALRDILPSNIAERRTIIDIFGFAGIVIPKNRPTFWGEYPSFAEREGPSNKNDWKYPVMWWTGSDGVNREALRFWFPQLR